MFTVLQLFCQRSCFYLFVFVESISFLFGCCNHSDGRWFTSHLVFFAFGHSWQWHALPRPGQPQCIEIFLASWIQKPGEIAGLRLFSFFKELWNPFLHKIWGNPLRKVRVENGAVLGALFSLLSSLHRLLRLGHNLQTSNSNNSPHLINEKTAHSTKSTADPK